MIPLEIIGLIAIIAGIFFTAGILYAQVKRNTQEFEVKMAMAKAQSQMKEMSSFEQIRNDINFIISFYIVHDIVFMTDELGKDATNEEQLIEQFVSSISAKTLLGMSDELKRQFSVYATIPENDNGDEDFLTYFIRKESFTKILTQMQVVKKKVK